MPGKNSAKSLKLMDRTSYEKWIQTLPSGICVFCHPDKYPQTVLKDGPNWQWIATLAPYQKYHTMLIPKKHYVTMDELSPQEFNEMFSLYNFALDKMRATELYFNNGERVHQFIFMWRQRDVPPPGDASFKKPNHLHLHIMPDDQTWIDPAMDPEAYLADIEILKSS